MQKRRDSGVERFRTAGIHDLRDTRKEGFRPGVFRTRGIQERSDTGKKGSMHEGFIKGEMVDKRKQDKWVVRQVGCRTGGMKGRRDEGKEGRRKGGIQE